MPKYLVPKINNLSLDMNWKKSFIYISLISIKICKIKHHYDATLWQLVLLVGISDNAY